MQTIHSISVDLDDQTLAKKLKLRYGQKTAALGSLSELTVLARALIHPRAVYETVFVEMKNDDAVKLGGVSFHSRILGKLLEPVHRAFPFILTIGPELEQAAAAQGDLLKQYYLEEIANYALEKASDWLSRRLEERYGVVALSSISPGSLEDWPITEQSKLFSIISDTEKLIGVRLTESMLMVPRKSISGIFFPSEKGFVACQLCERAECPGRKEEYRGES